MTLPVTGSQTVGPFFRIGMAPLFRQEVAPAGTPGERVTVQGRVLDGDGAGIPDATIEIWQADTRGRYADAGDKEGSFRGFGRVPTNEKGEFRFTTIRPGAVPAPDGSLQAPHLVVIVFMRGLLRHLLTRIYFADEAANESDAILKLVPADRRHTLIAARNESEAAFEWNVHMQGESETVFFEA
jgi:protocatechuate 3,4-dioxygenase alpha subunit